MKGLNQIIGAPTEIQKWYVPDTKWEHKPLHCEDRYKRQPTLGESYTTRSKTLSLITMFYKLRFKPCIKVKQLTT